MQELERMIDIYHTAYIACLVLTIVFLALSIFFFFKFEIKKIFDMKTGRGAKRSIREMEEINAKTGKLRTNDMTGRLSKQLRPEERITYPVTSPNPHPQPTGARDEGMMETEVLSGISETTLLSQNGNEETQHREIALPGAFRIKKEIMWIHTKEVL